MSDGPSFERLLAEATQHPVEDWDFSWLRSSGRFETGTLPWDYDQIVRERAHASPDLLDLGTGGGERLAGLAPHPLRTVATESFAPNVPVAARRLGPLGIQVVRTAAAPDNDRQTAHDPTVATIPFRDGSFHLVIDRNEAFVAREVARVLAPSGRFVTEQTGGSEILELHRLLGYPPAGERAPRWNLRTALAQIESARLRPVRSEEARFEMVFRDVGALTWYLRAVPWAVPAFSLDRDRSRLRAVHSQLVDEGPIRVACDGFWVEAVK